MLLSLVTFTVYDINFSVVSECGASVYSTTKLAAEELPEIDINLRSAGEFI